MAEPLLFVRGEPEIEPPALTNQVSEVGGPGAVRTRTYNNYSLLQAFLKESLSTAPGRMVLSRSIG